MVEPGAAALLLEGLRDPDALVRAAAAKSLDEHDGAEVVEGLVASLRGPRTRRSALSRPRCTRGQEGARVRARCSSNGPQHPDPFVQASALRALRELILPDALAAALKALAEPGRGGAS